MGRRQYAAALAAMIGVTAQPCAAADPGRDMAGARGRLGAFAGLGVRLQLGGTRRPVAVARLQLGTAYQLYDGRTRAPLRAGPLRGFELGATRSGAPALSFDGRPAAEMNQKLGFKGSTYVIVGGLVLLVLLAAAVANASPKPGPRPGDF